jgi:plasmid stabilization system protein ParE
LKQSSATSRCTTLARQFASASVSTDRAQILLQHPEAGTILDELREGGWRKLIFRRWKIIYTIRDDAIIVGRVWPAALGEADLETPL